MDGYVKTEEPSSNLVSPGMDDSMRSLKGKSKASSKDGHINAKRRCVSTACIACRRRKSKCDGNLPKCAACASVYLTECEYAPHTDHRRKGVYKKDADNLKTKNATLQILIQAILNYEEDDAIELVKQMRMADNLEEVAQSIEAKEKGIEQDPDSPVYDPHGLDIPKFDSELSSKMGDLLLDGSVKFIGGTSNLIWLDDPSTSTTTSPSSVVKSVVRPREEAILSWTTVTKDKDMILHLLNMYFCWHYSYFTTLPKELFYKDFLTGTDSQYCSAVLVNAMLALGCHFSSKPAARADPEDSSTIGDHYFAEARRLIYSKDEFSQAKLCSVQALALMSVREAGCGRESKGWVYSGMSFRMASDLGLNVDAPAFNDVSRLSDEDIDARRITFWGCFLFDKCWSNYLGREPQLQLAHSNTKKFEVFASEDSEMWSPYTDAGIIHTNAQPARTRAVALEISKLAEISSDLLTMFYQPSQLDKPVNKQAELKKLSEIHTRLEAWKRDLSPEMEPKDGQLPSVLLMHMFFQLLYIHLYRPFLRYTKSTSPLPAHVSPRKYCTQAAGTISKLLRLYKRTHGLRQIINKVVYIAHSACTIHLLNLPEKNAKRDIVHGVKQLEEIGECWTAARRTLNILHTCADKWKIELPEEAVTIFARTKIRWGSIEPLASPTTSSTISIMSQKMTSEAAPHIADRNLQLQRQQKQQQQQQQQPPPLPQTSQQISDAFTSVQNFPTQLPGPAPTSPSEILNERRSSDVLPMPAHSVADQQRSFGSVRPSTQLTREQQEAWNTHQARMAVNSQSRQHATRNMAVRDKSNAANLFGGVESLIEESQNWWYNDQNQLAMGFDNWNAPTADWSSLSGLGYRVYGDVATGHQTNVNPNSFYGSGNQNTVGNSNDMGQIVYDGLSPDVGQFSKHRLDSAVISPSSNTQELSTGGKVRDGASGMKRQGTWEDDMFY